MDLVPVGREAEPATTSGAITLVQDADKPLTDHEAYLKRVKDAEELEKKLKEISEKVPTKICNVSGSTAGAGSGDFHRYRQQKRRDQMRQSRIDAELKKDKEQLAFEQTRVALLAKEEEKTNKRRAKRQKQKEKRKRARNSKNTEPAGLAKEHNTKDVVSDEQDLGLDEAGLD